MTAFFDIDPSICVEGRGNTIVSLCEGCFCKNKIKFREYVLVGV